MKRQYSVDLIELNRLINGEQRQLTHPVERRARCMKVQTLRCSNEKQS